MVAPKPMLGYRSRSAAVMALRAAGRSTEEIGVLTGLEPKTIAALELSAGRSRFFHPTGHHRTVIFPVEVLEALRPAAVVREVSPNELARRIVEAAVDGDLIDAILDDAEGEGA